MKTQTKTVRKLQAKIKKLETENQTLKKQEPPKEPNLGWKMIALVGVVADFKEVSDYQWWITLIQELVKYTLTWIN